MSPPLLRLGLLAALALCAACSAASPRATSRDLSLYAGRRWFQDDLAGPVEEQGQLGLEYHTYSVETGLGWETALFYSEDDALFMNVPIEARTAELSAGVRKTFFAGRGRLRPYLGGGLSLLHADVDIARRIDIDDDEQVLGLYAHAGFFLIMGNFNLGLDYRHLFTDEFDLAGVEADGEYAQASFVLGYSF